MATIIRKEVRKRSFFGKIIKYLFIGFNIIMALWFFGGMFGVGSDVAKETDAARKAGGAIGMALGLGLVGMIWAIGDLILGLFVLLTRGKTTIVEESHE